MDWSFFFSGSEHFGKREREEMTSKLNQQNIYMQLFLELVNFESELPIRWKNCDGQRE
jgi:hypothetical protein